MCLSCGYYNGRQVMDLETQKTKRDARIKAKEDRISADTGTGETVTGAHPEHKEVMKDTHKEAPESTEQTKRPVRRRESKG